MDLAEGGEHVVHLHDVCTAAACTRPAWTCSARTRHADIYRALSARHPQLFAELPQHRAKHARSRSRASSSTRILYGERKLLNRVRCVKPLLDRDRDLDAEAVALAAKVMTSSRWRPHSTAASTPA